jgi:hypothetical protein
MVPVIFDCEKIEVTEEMRNAIIKTAIKFFISLKILLKNKKEKLS